MDLPGGLSPTGPFTLSVWLKPESHGGMVYGDVAGPIVCGLTDTSRAFIQRLHSAGWARVESDRPVPLHEWSQLRITYDGEELKVRLNDVLTGRTPCTGKVNSQRCALGRNPYSSGSSYFHGWMDEFELRGGVKLNE